MKSPQIIFEDENLLAINKPSGMVVNESNALGTQGSSLQGGVPAGTLQGWVEENFNFPLAHNKGLRNGIVHRIDKETSGVLLIAKTEDVFRELQRQFKDRETKKTYVALVHGRVEPSTGTIDAPIRRNPKVRTKFSVLENGREAVTNYCVLAHFNARQPERGLKSATTEEYSLVEFNPKTGRTHQIRVHAKHIGHPIVADYLYAGRKTTRQDRKWCPRLFLHAQKLTFTHPETGKRMTVEAPLPEELQEVLNKLSS